MKTVKNLHTQKWFTSKIGKRVFRDPCCDCKTCKEIEERGMIIANEQHAEYLYTIQIDFAQEGQYLNYRDTK